MCWFHKKNYDRLQECVKNHKKEVILHVYLYVLSCKDMHVVDAQNFLVCHVPLCEWTKRELSYLKGMLSPKLDTKPVDLPNG